MAQLPAGATWNRTVAAPHKIEEALMADTGSVANVLSVAGRSFAGNGQNTGMSFALLKDWSERRSTDKSSVAVAKRAQTAAERIRDASIFLTSPPLIRSLVTTRGFALELKDVVMLETRPRPRSPRPSL